MRQTAWLLLVLLALPAWGQEEAAPDEGRARRAVSDLGLVIDPKKPMQIMAEEFQVVRDEQGGDIITFSRNVVAAQDQMNLECDWLEAHYPPGGGNADRITARGGVRLSQPGSEITCSQLEYDSSACRVVCQDQPAVVTRGEDVMRGREIDLDFCKGILRVRGGASIQLKPASPDEDGAEASE